jgi:hypothetical protein
MDGRNRWMVFNVGCIECGVSSGVVGFYMTEDEAKSVAAVLNDKLSWRDGGQNNFEVYDLSAPPSSEYAEALSGSAK